MFPNDVLIYPSRFSNPWLYLSRPYPINYKLKIWIILLQLQKSHWKNPVRCALHTTPTFFLAFYKLFYLFSLLVPRFSPLTILFIDHSGIHCPPLLQLYWTFNILYSIYFLSTKKKLLLGRIRMTSDWFAVKKKRMEERIEESSGRQVIGRRHLSSLADSKSFRPVLTTNTLNYFSTTDLYWFVTEVI